jgi:hypothetical protein
MLNVEGSNMAKKAIRSHKAQVAFEQANRIARGEERYSVDSDPVLKNFIVPVLSSTPPQEGNVTQLHPRRSQRMGSSFAEKSLPNGDRD